MLRIIVDGKIIKCKRVMTMTPLDEMILNILKKKPMIERDIRETLNHKHIIVNQSSLSRHLKNLMMFEIIDYRMLDGKRKEFFLRGNKWK